LEKSNYRLGNFLSIPLMHLAPSVSSVSFWTIQGEQIAPDRLRAPSSMSTAAAPPNGHAAHRKASPATEAAVVCRDKPNFRIGSINCYH